MSMLQTGLMTGPAAPVAKGAIWPPLQVQSVYVGFPRNVDIFCIEVLQF